jgi:hypothetical protein
VPDPEPHRRNQAVEGLVHADSGGPDQASRIRCRITISLLINYFSHSAIVKNVNSSMGITEEFRMALSVPNSATAAISQPCAAWIRR